MAPNLQKLCGRLVRQGLFEAKELESIYRDWRAASPKERDSIESFAQFLVLRGHVGIDRLQQCMQGLPQSLNTTPMPREDSEFDVELVSERDGVGRRDIIVASIGIIVGAATAALVAFVLRK